MSQAYRGIWVQSAFCVANIAFGAWNIGWPLNGALSLWVGAFNFFVGGVVFFGAFDSWHTFKALRAMDDAEAFYRRELREI